MAHTKVNCTPVKEQIEKSIDFILNLNEIELIQTEEISKINEIDSEFDVDSQFTKVQQKNRDFEKEHNAFNICKANDTEHSVYPLGNVSETTYEEDIEILENDIDISDKVSSTDNGNDNSTPENAHKYDTGNIFKTKCNNIEVAYKSEDNIKKSSTIVSHNIDSSVDVGNRNLHNKKSNTNDKLHTCDTCGKTLQTLSGFTRHRRSHLHNKKSNTKYKLHTCDTCGKTFQSLSCLTRHRRSHESRGRKLYNCDICGTNYTSSSGLLKHQRLHTGERPFICDQCGKSFVDSGRLLIHIRQHHGKQPFKCNICGKRMPTLYVLQIHIRSHTGEKPYQCDSCGKKFVTKVSCRIHINTFHNDKISHNLWHGLYL